MTAAETGPLLPMCAAYPAWPATPRDSFIRQPSPMATSELALGRTSGRIASSGSGASSRVDQPSAKRTRSSATTVTSTCGCRGTLR
jgi:hypothetical protein